MLFNPHFVIEKQDARVLLLHGLFSKGECKCSSMRCSGFDVDVPPLNNWLFWWAIRQAKPETHHDIIVGSSRGGAVALNLDTNLPLVLLAPAWKYYGKKDEFTNPCVIIHGKRDTLIPYTDSIELVNQNPNAQLIIVDDDHQLNSWTTHRLMIREIKRLTKENKK